MSVRPRDVREIFLTFARIGLSGFGGVLFWMRRVLIQEKRWVTDEELLEGLAIGQILPGPNVYNLSFMIGYRFAGLRGAFAAVGGLLAAPVVILVCLGLLYRVFSSVPFVHNALAGMAAVAAGLLLSSAVGMAAALPRRFVPWLFMVAAFVAVGVLRWPLIYVILGLAPVAVLVAWQRQ
ncbi:MAG TPA: chromate transporter [Burkholderiales bacterium]|nr:chromate transporter [Burkholderiales bacterium]